MVEDLICVTIAQFVYTNRALVYTNRVFVYTNHIQFLISSRMYNTECDSCIWRLSSCTQIVLLLHKSSVDGILQKMMKVIKLAW